MKKLLYLFCCLFAFVACESYDEEIIVGQYDNGIPVKVEYYNFIKGEKQKVKEVSYFNNGEKEQEVEYLNGQFHGKYRLWYNNGQLWIDELYENGIKHGKFIVYSDDGDKSFSGEYNQGAKTGEWNFWDNKGNLVKTEKY